MKAHAYMRTSSTSQPLTLQRVAIEKAAEARGDEVVEWFAEQQSSRTMQRPELLRLRDACRAGHVRRLYVFRADRLCRTGIRDLMELIEFLRACGVQIISLADGFDFDGPAAEVVLAVMAWAAKMERIATNERISHARARLIAAGRTWGRQSTITAAQRDRMRALKREGMTIREIAKRVKIPRSSVARALSQSVGAPAATAKAAKSGTSEAPVLPSQE